MDFLRCHFPSLSSKSRTPPRLIFLVDTETIAGRRKREEEEEEELKEIERAKRKQKKSQMESEATRREDLSPEAKRFLRECIASESPSLHELAESLLNNEKSEKDFRKEYGEIKEEDRRWGDIFKTQRAIREKIQNLYFRTESYKELIPRQKKIFDTLLKEAKMVNKKDDSTDRTLKRELFDLTQADAKTGRPAILGPTEANELYALDPNQDGFERVLAKYKPAFDKLKDDGYTFRRILALKKEEARIEQQFHRVHKRLDEILQRNVSKTRVKGEKEQILKSASTACGITVEEGVELEYRNPEIVALPEDQKTLKIRRVTFDEIKVRGKKGEHIAMHLGAPKIELSNGAKMTLGRFKKWIDAADVVEKVDSIDQVQIKTGLFDYGIKVQKDLDLSYPRYTRNQKTGEVNTIIMGTRITEIDKDTPGGRIYFSEAVAFMPGFREDDEYELRDWLSFGEFVKWWHRYEVEKSVGLQETRELLRRYNEIENKTFGLEAKDSPPILLDSKSEILQYPDEWGEKYSIEGIESDGVIVEGKGKMKFPEFFHWIKNNHVRKIPQVSQSSEELQKEEEHRHKVAAEKASDEAKKEEKLSTGEGLLKDILQRKKEIEASTPMEKIKEIWYQTTFLSFKDLWNMTKEIVEFVKRKHERQSRARFGGTANRLPGRLGTEFERIKQSAETEEVNKYKEAMEHWGIFRIRQTLYQTNDNDEAKACVLTLVHKGEMRFDDPHMWDTLNRLTARYTFRGTELYIPDPKHMPPGENGEELAIKAINALWGEGTGEEWYAENSSKYNSMKKNFEYKFRQLENDPKGTGGPTGELKRMLRRWRKGEYVNPQEYEAIIDGAIKYGKMSGEAKMFYILAGVIARHHDNPYSETLLHIDRLGELNSAWLNQFPLLDYFTQVKTQDWSLPDEKTGKPPRERKLKLEDYVEIKDKYFQKEYDNCEPGAGFSKFMWQEMLMEENVRYRISKGLRNAENMDHEDAPIYIPPASPSEIDNLTSGPSGQKKYFTTVGYTNAYVGFNKWFVSLSEAIQEAKTDEIRKSKSNMLKDAFISFIRYDAIMDNRFKRKDGDSRQRLDDSFFNKPALVDQGVELRIHQKQLRGLVQEVGLAYGLDLSWLYREKFRFNQDKEQREYENGIEELNEIVPKIIETDGGAKAIDVIRRAKVRDPKSENGLRGWP